MDRLDAMKVFVVTLNEGSLAGASRRLGRSPAAVSRAIAFLETQVGTELLHRTTRSLRMSDAGERYAAICRRILIDLEQAESAAAGEQSAPRGSLTVTAPVLFGEAVLRPIVDAFLDIYPAVSTRLNLLDRPVNLIDQGVDVSLRIARLTDSALIAIRVGEVRRVVVASPRYLRTHPEIREPNDLARHQIIALTELGPDSWRFPPSDGGTVPHTVQFAPRLATDSARGAVESAIEGRGVICMFLCDIAGQVRSGELRIVLAKYEPPPIPVHLVLPSGRLSAPKVRAFVDFVVPQLRVHFARLAKDLSGRETPCCLQEAI